MCSEGLVRLFVICIQLGRLGSSSFFSDGHYSSFIGGHFFVDNWALIHSNQLVTLSNVVDIIDQTER